MGAARRKEPGTGKERKPAKAPQKSPGEEVTPEVLEFISAVESYKKQHGRPFPTWSEVLGILHALGYRKSAPPSVPPAPGEDD